MQEHLLIKIPEKFGFKIFFVAKIVFNKIMMC